MNELFCGSSCVKYILNKYGKQVIKFNNQMEWATELAICLKENGLNPKIYCYNSNLYKDYQKGKEIDISFKGFEFIQQCKDLNIPIIEKKLTKTELKQEIENYKCIILCVKSSKLNHDKSLTGGHFIIMNGWLQNKVKIIIPRKTKYEEQIESLSHIIKYCKDFGSWRILIKEEKND